MCRVVVVGVTVVTRPFILASVASNNKKQLVSKKKRESYVKKTYLGHQTCCHDVWAFFVLHSMAVWLLHVGDVAA